MKQIHHFAYDCISLYARFDKIVKHYEISVDDLPPFAQQEFASLIMLSDPDRGYESVSAENPAFEKTMIPSLINLLADYTHGENMVTFVRSWLKGVTSYHKNLMQEYLNDACWLYNSEKGFCDGEVA